MKRRCYLDELEPLAVSHVHMSTHSLQNGVQNINDYRWRVMTEYPKTSSKVKHCPVLKITNIGLMHRESLLLDIKNDAPDKIKQAHTMINRVSEVDTDLTEAVYCLETKIKELVDNHILGMFKLAYLFGLKETALSIPDVLTFDRLLTVFNPKTCKSEFADKGKFDAEGKGKASKKIKPHNKDKDREGFIKRISSIFPDVCIDFTNTNSRGKWSYIDRINHSPDSVFYSPMMKCIVSELQDKYNQADFPSFNNMLSMISTEINC